MQALVAFLILGNFFVNCLEKEIDPFPAHLQSMGDTWTNFDLFFNVVFTLEIVLNAWSCGGPYRSFWSSGWNIFDFVVVFCGLLLLSNVVDPTSPLSNLKMLRAFRVFRLFKRVKSLNKVIMALLRAIPGVANAFIIMVIFMMIYAILAVEYFGQLGQDFGPHPYGTYITYGDFGENHTIDAGTSRGFVYGWEYYGTFTRALFTLFQVMTGESWAEAIARPLMFGLYRNSVTVSLFFVSFILLTQIVLTNVVVAVLLDKFVEDTPQEGKEDEENAAEIDAAAMLDADIGVRPAPTALFAPNPNSPTPSSPVQVVDAMPAGVAGKGGAAAGPNVEAALGLILAELQTLKSAVARCEAGLESLREEARMTA